MSRKRLVIANTLSLLLFWTVLVQLTVAIELQWPPERFPAKREFAGESSLGEDFEDIEPLGRIVKLKTLFDPTDINLLNTKFTIHTRLGSSNLVSFIPNGFVYSSLEQFSDERFHYNLTTMANSNFEPTKRTVVIISGFMTNDRVEWMERVKDSWLALEDCNVIIVTWKEGNRYVYSRAAATTPRVARQVTIFLHYLASMHQTSIDDSEFASKIHFIGHSLGTHIAGFVGQDFRGQLGRILALDPAGPSFDQFSRDHRLDPTDALLVEAIHTNSGKMKYASFLKSGAKNARDKLYSLLGLDDMARSIAETFSGEGDSVWFGIDLPVGHIDYYANNGKVQPGCKGNAHICDHARSHHIYEGILQHELDLRAAELTDGVTFDQWRRDKRLLAIDATDFAGYASGEALNQRCPAMLHDRDRLSGLAEQQMSKCTVPVDQLTPVRELVKELSELHGVSFSSEASTPPSNQRFYLKTLADKPFVGDQYLFRIKLERSSVWEKSCALQAKVSFANNQSTTIELEKELRVFSNGKFFGLSLPFVNPNKAAARLALDKILHEYTIKNQNQNKHELDEEAEKLIEQILPSDVTLKIIENKSQSTISKWIKGTIPGPKCSLNIDSIQVHPLVGFKRSLFGLYLSQRPSETTKTKMLSHLEYKTRKHTKKVWPESLMPEHQNHERSLQIVVIG